MNFLGIKNERKVIDSVIVLTMMFSAYFVGYIRTMDLGALAITLTLPSLLLLSLGFIHLIIRSGRKFDESEHKLSYELLKALIYLGLGYSAFKSGISVKEGLIPPISIFSIAMMASLILSVYILAYRPNN